MSKKFKQYGQFISTIIVTSIVVLLLCMTVELILMFKCESHITKNELNVENLVKFATIEQLEKRLQREPTNYVVMIRLAIMNEELHKTSVANKLYQNALKYSSRSNYAIYHYAIFCAKNGLFATSSALAEELTGNNKKTIKYRAEIYETIADNLKEAHEYEASVKAYQIAYKYAKNVKNKGYLDSIAQKYATTYVKYADQLIENKMIAEAISALKNSLKIKETAIAKYKIALIYLDTNKLASQKYMEEVFNEEPYLVNPYIYNSLLNELISQAKNSNDVSALNYYTVKYGRFKEAIQDVYLYKEDILIDNSRIKNKNDENYLIFDLKNNTKNKIDQLYLDIELFLNTKRYRISKKVVHLAKTLAPYETLEDFEIKLPPNIEFVNVVDHNYLILKYYAKKSVKAPNTLIKIEALNF